MNTVKEILKKKGSAVCVIEKSATVIEAARMMNAKAIGAVVVTEKGKVIGMFSERDILTRVVVANMDPMKTLVEDVMTNRVVSCDLNTKMDECRTIMTIKRIRHLPVIDGDKLVGIVTIGDLLAHEVAAHRQTIDDLKHYIDGSFA